MEHSLYSKPKLFAPGNGQAVIVTRAQSRPDLLQRAIDSVLKQTFTNWLHVIVLDNALPSVQAIAQKYGERLGNQVRIVSIDSGRRMERASNEGVRAAAKDAEFITFLDDDDTWSPHFLSSTIQFLNGADGRSYGGVCTWTEVVEEHVDPSGKIEILKRWPHPPFLRTMSLLRVLETNRFFTNAFLFRKSACDSVGLYNEDLLVTGDWEFNIRFLVQFEVGVVPEFLSFYHHRPMGQTALDGNTLLQESESHERFDFAVRDEQIRRALRSHPELLSLFLAMGRYNKELSDRLTQIEYVLRRLNVMLSFLADLVRPLRRLVRMLRGQSTQNTIGPHEIGSLAVSVRLENER